MLSFAINIGLTFVLTPYIVGKVGSEQYGFVALAYNMVNYVAIFTSALNSMASRYISIAINSNNKDQANIYFNSVLRANTIIALVLLLPSTLLTVYVNKIFNVPTDIIRDVQLTFGFVFINIILSLLGNVFSVAVFSKNRLELSSYRAIEGNIIKLAITALLFFLFTPRIYYMTLAAISATLYTVITNVYYTKKLLPEVKISLKVYSYSAIKILIKSGIWNTVNQLSDVLTSYLDLMIVNIFIGSALAGQYSLSKTIPSFIATLISSLLSVFISQLTLLYAQSKQAQLVDNINLSIKIVGLIVIIPISFLVIFGDAFFTLWLPDENAGFLYLLSNLAIVPMIFTSSAIPINNVFTVTNKLKIPAIVLLINGLLNTAIIFILLKTTTLGVFAIPLVSAGVGLVRNLCFIPVYAARCLDIKWWSLYPSILKGVICAAVMMAICFAYKSLLSHNVSSWFEFITAAVLCAGISFIINIFILFSKRERMELLKGK